MRGDSFRWGRHFASVADAGCPAMDEGGEILGVGLCRYDSLEPLRHS